MASWALPVLTRLPVKSIASSARRIAPKIAAPPRRGMAVRCNRRASHGSSSHPKRRQARPTRGVSAKEALVDMTNDNRYVFMIRSASTRRRSSLLPQSAPLPHYLFEQGLAFAQPDIYFGAVHSGLRHKAPGSDGPYFAS